MSITLPPDLEQFIQKAVAGGEFASADEAVAAAVRRMQAEHERVRRLVQEGIDDLENGRYTDYDLEGLRKLRDELIARAHRVHEAATRS